MSARSGTMVELDRRGDGSQTPRSKVKCPHFARQIYISFLAHLNIFPPSKINTGSFSHGHMSDFFGRSDRCQKCPLVLRGNGSQLAEVAHAPVSPWALAPLTWRKGGGLTPV